MADTLYLPDGTMEVICSLDDFQKLIYNRLGREAEQEIIKLRNAADYTEAKIDTDLASYESSLESNAVAFQDILKETKQMKVLLNTKRINRLSIYVLMDNIETLISNQI